MMYVVLKGLNMEKLAPLSMSIIDTEEYVRRKDCMPVTSYAMYEPSTERFHPDGLYSEVIFGQLGSSQRFIRRAFIDLHTKVITPHLYKQIIELKRTSSFICIHTIFHTLAKIERLKRFIPHQQFSLIN